jgi:hypothetical protein
MSSFSLLGSDSESGSAKGVSSVGTVFVLLEVPAMPASSAALVTSPGAPSAPAGIRKVKCTFVPSKLTLTVAALPAGSVFTASTTALAKGGPCAPSAPRGMPKVRCIVSPTTDTLLESFQPSREREKRSMTTVR